MIVVVKSGRACLRVGLAAHLASRSSVTGISASLQALVLPGALSILFLLFQKLQLFTPGGVVLLPGRPSWWTCRAPCATWLRTGPTSPGASTDPFHLHILHSFCFSRNVTEILRLVQAFRHSDRTGHVSHKHLILLKRKKMHLTCHRPCPPTGLLGARKFPQTSPTRWRISSRSTERGRRCQMRRPLWTTTWRTRSRWRRWRSLGTLGRRS